MTGSDILEMIDEIIHKHAMDGKSEVYIRGMIQVKKELEEKIK